MRVCRVCEIEKPLSEYYSNKRSKGGYYNYCKSCAFEKKRDYVRTCSAIDCHRKTDGGPYCFPHDYRIKNGINLSEPIRTPEKMKLVGPLPKKNEKAIYILRRESDNISFYVGATKSPKRRLAAHKLDFGQVEMFIVRCVPYSEVVYWESKTLVDLIDNGCPIINSESPVSN